MSKSFYNTNSERGQQLKASEAKAAKQDDRVLQVFKNSGITWTAYDIYLCLGRHGWPLTSIRRSINTLCKGKKVIETGGMRKGGYGKLNRVYKYNPKAK